MAEIVAKYLVDENLGDSIEFTERSQNIKMKLSLSLLPEDICKALKVCTKETTTAFTGKRGMKVRILSAKLLSKDSLANIKALTQTYKFDDWVEQMLEEKAVKEADLGKKFYKQVEG